MPLSRERRPLFYGWWVVFGCFFYGLYSGGAIFYGFTAIFEPIAKEFGWSYKQISLAASLRGLEIGILSPLLGILVDRWGARRLMIAGSIITGFGVIFLSQVQSLGMFYAIFIVIAIGISPSGGTVQLSAVAFWFSRNAGKATGIVASGFAMGGLILPIITHLIDTYGWRSVMIGLGLGMWLIGLPLALLVRHKPEKYGFLPDGDRNDDDATNGREMIRSQKSEGDFSGRQAFRSRSFWHITVNSMLNLLVIGAVMTHVMPYLSTVAIKRSVSGLVAGALPLSSIGGRLGFGWLVDSLNKRLVATITTLLLTLSLLFFNYVTEASFWAIIPFVICFGTAWGGNVTTRVALLRDHFGRSKFGTILGFSTAFMMIGNMAGPTITGWIFDRWGSYQGAWYTYAALSMLSAAIIALTPPVKKA